LFVLFIMLALLRLPAWMAALTAMLSAGVLAAIVWGMPLGLDVSATTEGMAFGLWPISWIVLNAVFFHDLTVASGDFDVIRRSLTRLTEDRRVQALIVAFCFGALMEGIAGFGAPVAISAAIMASLGFEPITAAVLALLANTAPVAFGSIGIPIVTLGGLTAGITAGVTFAVVQFLISNFVGPELTDVIAALVSICAVALLLRSWRPKEIWGFPSDRAPARPAVARSLGAAVAQVADPPRRVAAAYSM